MRPRKPRITVYRGADAQWYWRLVAANGNVQADGAEGYTRRASAQRAVKAAQRAMARAVIVPATTAAT
jgi:hypothetical protein